MDDPRAGNGSRDQWGSNMRILQTTLLLCGIWIVAGCATVTTGSNDTVTIDTDPTGATCHVTRGDKQIGVVNPTPGSLEVPKSQHDLTVRCDREGYLTSQGMIESGFQAMTLGNAILGGFIGLAVDAASGAMTRYEDGVRVTMIPESFPTAAERDAFFDRVIAGVEDRYKVAVQQIEKNCGDASNCEQKLKEAEMQRDARLAELERQRGEAAIAGEPGKAGETTASG